MNISPERETRELRLQQIRREAELRATSTSELPSVSHADAHPSNGHGALQDFQPAASASPQTGYYGMPLLKTPSWTWEVPIYFFVGGAAGASAMLASVGKLTGADQRMIRDARWLAAIGAAISPPLLISDLGFPRRFLNMLRIFKVQSPMSVGSWTLMSFSSAAVASAVLTELEGRRVFPRIPVLTDVAEIGAALTGLVLATYTGVLVGATAIPVWNAKVSLIPIHFATSGLSTAVSVLELRGHTSSALNKIGIGATVVETAIGASLEFGKKPATEPLHHGPTGWTMRVAGLLSGPLPLALRLLSLTSPLRSSRAVKLRKAAAISSIAGSLVTRWAWVYAGRASSKDPKVPLELPGPARPDAKQIPQDK
jgi:formate-dependent nitrite reductase membrane component NrfD